MALSSCKLKSPHHVTKLGLILRLQMSIGTPVQKSVTRLNGPSLRFELTLKIGNSLYVVQYD